MQLSNIPRVVLFLPILLSIFILRQVLADGNVHKVKHLIVVMQENHSFDN